MTKNTVSHHKLIILGSGPAGYTAAIYSARANLNPLLFTGYNKGGQLINTNEIENWPGDAKVITGHALMTRMYNHAKSLRTNIISNEIIKINFTCTPFILTNDLNENFTADSIIIATGASPKYLGLPSEEVFKGKGVSTCATCDGYFYKNDNVAVIGGGSTALEEALYLSNIAKTVHLVHRRNKFNAEKVLISRVLKKTNKNIVLHMECTVKEILGNEQGVTGIKIICNSQNVYSYIISIAGVFIAIGFTPNTKIFENKLLTKNNYIIVKSGIHRNSTQTSIPGVFAAGDVVDHVYRQAITSSASGCMAALDAEQYLDEKYND